VSVKGGQPDVTNSQDMIYVQGGSASIVKLRRRKRGKGYRDTLTVGVQPKFWSGLFSGLLCPGTRST
jgi:hypothetical protein